jgi:HlyD family secretion protein
MKKKRILWISIISLVVLVVVAMVMKGGKKDLEVEMVKVENRTITEIVSVTGKIQPESEVKISADVSGEIIDMMVHEGDSVTKGQLLLRINPELYETAMSQLKANLDNTKAALAGSEAQLIKAKAAYDQAGLTFKRQKSLHGKRPNRSMNSQKQILNRLENRCWARDTMFKALQLDWKRVEGIWEGRVFMLRHRVQ